MNFPHNNKQTRAIDILRILIILVLSLQVYNSIVISQTKQIIPDNGVDLSFDPKLRNPSSIITAKQFDGKLLVFGNIDEINGDPIGKRGDLKLLRFNEDGSIDNTLSFDITKSEYSHIYNSADIFPTQSGHIFLISKLNSNRIIKLNSDGSLDDSFRYDFLPYTKINKIIERSDGKYLFFGDFKVVNSRLQVITRDVELVNSDGTLDELFGAFIGQNDSDYGIITDAFILNDGKMIIAGNFSAIQGGGNEVFPRNGLAKLNADGSIDESFNPNIYKLNNSTLEILPTSNSQFYIFGAFNRVNQYERQSVARLNPDGTTDASFNCNASTNEQFNSYTLQNDGKLVVSKVVNPNTNTYNNVVTVKNIRLNVTGEADNSFISPEISVGRNYYSFGKTISDSNNNIIITNCLGKIDGKTRLGLARLQPNGLLDESYVRNLISTQIYSGLNSKSLIESVAAQSDGKIIVAGNFSVLNGEWIGIDNETSMEGNYAVRLNTDGSLDKVFDLHNFSGDSNRTVSVDYQGRIIFCSTGKLWRFNPDGVPDTTFVSPYNFSVFVVLKMFPLPDGKIILTSNYPHGPLHRLNENGSFDQSFSYPSQQLFPSGSYDTYQFTVQDDGKVVFGGGRNRYGNRDMKLLPRLLPDGTIDNNFDLTPYPNDKSVFADRITAKNGKIYISARLQDYYRKSLYRLNNNGVVEKDFNVNAREILVQPDDKIIFIGRFLSKNLSRLRNVKRPILLSNLSRTYFNLCRIDQNGVADKSFSFFSRGAGTFASDFNKPAEMALQPDGNLIVVGDFDEVNGVRRVGIVRLKMN
jgi:uncharacterized delta-60 repeat protein